MTDQFARDVLVERSAARGVPADPPPEWFSWAVGQAPERALFEYKGARLELLTWGPVGAPGVLLLHGFRAHADWWSHLAPFLAGNHRVAALSFSGMGGSDWRPGYSLQLYAREAAAAAREAGLFAAERPPVVIAHSLGGHVATLLSADEGERFAGMVLVEVTLAPRPPNPPPDLERRTYPTAADAAGRFRFTPAQSSDPHVSAWIAMHGVAETVDAEGATAWGWRFDPMISSRLDRQHAWLRLPDARCPLAFVRGARSQWSPTASRRDSDSRRPKDHGSSASPRQAITCLRISRYRCSRRCGPFSLFGSRDLLIRAR